MALIRNTIIVAVILIIYYASLLGMLYMIDIFNSISLFTTYPIDPVAQLFLDVFFYYVIPLAIVIAYIIHTQPHQQIVQLRRF